MAILLLAFALAVSALLPVRVEASDSLMVVHLEYIRKDISDLKTDMAELKTEVKGVKADISRLKADMAELKTEVKGVKADISELKTDMNGRFDDVDKRITANTDRLFFPRWSSLP